MLGVQNVDRVGNIYIISAKTLLIQAKSSSLYISFTYRTHFNAAFYMLERD
jgi:hypothetical protein